VGFTPNFWIDSSPEYTTQPHGRCQRAEMAAGACENKTERCRSACVHVCRRTSEYAMNAGAGKAILYLRNECMNMTPCLCRTEYVLIGFWQQGLQESSRANDVYYIYVSAAIVWLQPPNHVTFAMEKRREVEVSRQTIMHHHNMYRLIKIGTTCNNW